MPALVDDDDTRVGFLRIQQRREDAGGGSDRQVRDDQVAFVEGLAQPLGGGPVVDAGSAEQLVDLGGAGTGGLGGENLPDRQLGQRIRGQPLHRDLGDGDAAGRGGGDGRLVPFGVGVALQDEHDVRVPDVLDRGQLFTGHDPDAFVVLAETLGQDEGPVEAGQGFGQLREGFARVGHDRDLRVAARRCDGGVDGAAVRGNRDGVVPGQPDAGERLGNRRGACDDLRTQPDRPQLADDAEPQRVTGGEDHDVGVLGQLPDLLDGGGEATQDDSLVLGDGQLVEVTAPADHHGRGGDGAAQLLAGGAEMPVDRDHVLSPFSRL